MSTSEPAVAYLAAPAQSSNEPPRLSYKDRIDLKKQLFCFKLTLVAFAVLAAASFAGGVILLVYANDGSVQTATVVGGSTNAITCTKCERSGKKESCYDYTCYENLIYVSLKNEFNDSYANCSVAIREKYYSDAKQNLPKVGSQMQVQKRDSNKCIALEDVRLYFGFSIACFSLAGVLIVSFAGFMWLKIRWERRLNT